MTNETKAYNPLINKLNKSNNIPGMTFRLPSKGLPYKAGELADDVMDGEIVIFPMSTLDEIYLKTPDMLFQGTAIERTISRCCPQVLKPLELLSKDVDYILTCMRLVSYGNILTVPFKCDCGKADEVDLQVPISSFLSTTKTIEKEDIDRATFELEGFVIKTKFVSFLNMIKVTQEHDTSTNDPEKLFNLFIDNLSLNVESIDTIDDKEMIVDFLKAQHRKFQMDLLDNIQKINNWGIKFEYVHRCKWCDKDKTLPISLNPVSFFSEPSSQAPESNA
jgi:hypothetical protein